MLGSYTIDDLYGGIVVCGICKADEVKNELRGLGSFLVDNSKNSDLDIEVLVSEIEGSVRMLEDIVYCAHVFDKSNKSKEKDKS
ncbi:hypothetical protein VCSRO55_0730 [Vibrio cholerae]|uniref:hypothetical protein n=1 Tax=Vibrio cholerae TaxID=666 RepID=UPI0011D7F469|nr:hypothetical protein [Vibrio cholerae]EGR2498603.1 hypothetical protein [Vibrio cholerae]TXZ57255.1 hypothetical protein FXE54_02950 [Vibrio cholerae]GHW19930.1 hypothetical protein VCSRO55_0730 [Vibrio cholerae]